MKSNKSQIQTQVFVYILGLLIIGLVLLYGYKSINTMRQKSDQIDLLAFKTDIEQEISKMSSDYGSSRLITLKVPSSFKSVCFVDLRKAPSSEMMEIDPLVYESWVDKTANVFLIKDLAEEFLLIEENSQPIVELDPPGYLCISVKNSRVQIRLEGTGGKALVSAGE